MENLLAKVRSESPGEVGLRQRMVEAMTTNELSFFRDLHPFDGLSKVIIPGLIARRARLRTLRIWCAACSRGQEPSSIAMLLSEHFGPQLAGWDVSILATDRSSDILAKAPAGQFSQMEVNRGVPASMLLKSFRKVGSEWFLKDEVRRAVTFQHLNLIGPWPLIRPVDVIMLRNVLIYFDPVARRDLLKRAAKLPATDG